jgi:hypothetical protein
LKNILLSGKKLSSSLASHLPYIISSLLPSLFHAPSYYVYKEYHMEKMVTFEPQKVIVYSIDSIPCSTTHLIWNLYDYQLFYTPFTQPLPTSISHLTLQHFNGSLAIIPHTVTRLVTFHKFNQPVYLLPPQLTHFTTGQIFNQSVDGLPLTLTHLTTGYYFNQPVDKLLFTLTHFTTGDRFNQQVDKLPLTLTPQLEKISINQLINFHSHSPTLTHIKSKTQTPIKPFEIREPT